MGKVMTKDIKILTAKISRLYSAELIDSYQNTLPESFRARKC